MNALTKVFSKTMNRREKLNYILDKCQTFDCVEIMFAECLERKNFVLPYEKGGNADLIGAKIICKDDGTYNAIMNFYSYSTGNSLKTEFFIDAIKAIAFWNIEKEAEKPSVADTLDKDFKKFQEIFVESLQKMIIANIINQSGKESK